MPQERLELLLKAVAGLSRMLILPHNDPDPDAIASGIALRHLLAEKSNVEARIAYGGIVGRAENKALVRYLGHPLRYLTGEDVQWADALALVDTQPGAGNNAMPRTSKATVVIDHHSLREETAAATFADVRSEVGATSTMLTEYLKTADVEIPPPLATALFYGIKTDTMGLGRGASPTDTTAYFYLQPHIDVDALIEIERAQVPTEYFKSFDRALHSVRNYGGVLVAYIGHMSYPDLAAEIADLLLRLEGARWVICIGVNQDELILSVRTRSRTGGAGKLAQRLVGERGSAGGHGMMGAGHLVLDGQDPAQLAEQISQRALQSLNVSPGKEGKPIL